MELQANDTGQKVEKMENLDNTNNTDLTLGLNENLIGKTLHDAMEIAEIEALEYLVEKNADSMFNFQVLPLSTNPGSPEVLSFMLKPDGSNHLAGMGNPALAAEMQADNFPMFLDMTRRMTPTKTFVSILSDGVDRNYFTMETYDDARLRWADKIFHVDAMAKLLITDHDIGAAVIMTNPAWSTLQDPQNPRDSVINPDPVSGWKVKTVLHGFAVLESGSSRRTKMNAKFIRRVLKTQGLEKITGKVDVATVDDMIPINRLDTYKNMTQIWESDEKVRILQQEMPAEISLVKVILIPRSELEARDVEKPKCVLKWYSETTPQDRFISNLFGLLVILVGILHI